MKTKTSYHGHGIVLNDRSEGPTESRDARTGDTMINTRSQDATRREFVALATSKARSSIGLRIVAERSDTKFICEDFASSKPRSSHRAWTVAKKFNIKCICLMCPPSP